MRASTSRRPRPRRMGRLAERCHPVLRSPHRLWTLCSCLALLGAVVGLSACSGDAANSEGARLFREDCALCHGPEGGGKSGVASSLVGNPTVRELSDGELVELIVEGLPASHPRNDSGVPMPPKGGHPELTEEQIGRIVGYLRELQP